MLGIVLGLALVGGLDASPASPPAWSPDGRWLAHVSAPTDPARLLRPGEVWGVASDESLPVEPAGPGRRRLWVNRTDNARSLPLLEWSGPLGAPGWTRDGGAVLLQRGVVEAERVVRMELVRLESSGRERILWTERVDLSPGEAERIVAEPPAVSPDGSTALIPCFNPQGLAHVGLSDGGTLRTFEGMKFPAWSPDGFRAAMCRVRETATLMMVEPRRGEPKPLMELGAATQPPVWSGDGRSLYVVSGPTPPKFGDIGRSQGPGLIRVSPDTGQAEPALGQELDRPMPGLGPVKSLSFAIDRPGENLFYCAARLDSAVGVTWYRPRDGLFFKRFPLIDERFPSDALTLSPSGKHLAARMFGLEQSLSPVIFDLEKSVASIAAPDDLARAEWTAFLARNCRAVIDGHRAGKIRTSPFESRSPSPLPLPGEFADNGEEMIRLRRLARLGLSVRRSGDSSDAPSRTVSFALDEAALMFAYLAGDHAEATAALVRLESAPGSPAHNLMLLGLRGQISLSGGDLDGFEEVVGLIERIESRGRSEIVYIGERPVVTPIPPERARWTESLRMARVRLERDEAEEPRRGGPEIRDARPILERPGFGPFEALDPLRF